MPLAEVTASALIAGFPEPMLVIESDGTLVFTNAAAVSLLALKEAPDGRNIVEFLPEQERNRLKPLAWLQRWADTPDAPEINYVHLLLRTDSGAEIPVRVRVGRVWEKSETRYLVMLHDISAEQARQQESRQAHRLAARVLAISADAIVTVNEQFNVTYANPSAERLFGYASGELVGMSLDRLLPERFRSTHLDQIRRFGAESSPARLMGERSEVLGLRSNGEEIPLEASITKVTLDRTVMFSAHLRDLRPRKAQEAQLARSMASFKTVFEHALQAMALIDRDGRVQQMNRSARRLMPAAADPIGQPFASLPFWSNDPQATRDQLQRATDACLAGNVYRMPAMIYFPDGGQRQLDFSLTPVIDQGETFAMIAEARELLDQTDDGDGA